MSDIFVSYKREDFARVERLVGALRGEGFNVWWDQDIPTGAPWEAAITAALDNARCVLVCWSEVSTHPQHGAKVQIEARVANDTGKLIQIKLEATTQPLFFRQWQAADLSGWTGDQGHSSFQRVAAAARAILAGEGPALFDASANPTPRKRRRALLGAAVAAVALLGVGAAAIATPDGQLMVCSVRNPDRICLSEKELKGFEAALSDAKTRLAQRAVFYINDRRQNFPTMGWSIAQLAAPNTEGLKSHRPGYNSRMADLLNNPCRCLLNGEVPHTISNAWMLIADANFAQGSPSSVIDSMLAGQSTEGWWSSVLDAVDEPDSGSIYATSFAILSLQRQIQYTLDPVRARSMRRAIDAGAGWLVHQMSTREGWLADYPQSVRKISNPGIDGEAVAALAAARPEVNLRARAAPLARSMTHLPPLWTQPSSDVLVTRRDGTQYYDQIRHISAAWTVLGAVSGMRDLSALERARVQSAVRRVFARDLESPELFKAEWVAAEAIFALGESVERLQELRESGLGPRAETPIAETPIAETGT